MDTFPSTHPRRRSSSETTCSLERNGFRGGQRQRLLNSLPFSDGVYLVSGHVLKSLRLAGRPAHFDQVNLSRRSQTEMDPQIVLREIASPSAHFVELRHGPSMNGDTRSNRGAVALGPN